MGASCLKSRRCLGLALALGLIPGQIAAAPGNAVNPIDTLADDSARVFKDLENKEYRAASEAALKIVRALRAHAATTENQEDRDSYYDAACLMLEVLDKLMEHPELTAELVKERSELRTEGHCPGAPDEAPGPGQPGGGEGAGGSAAGVGEAQPRRIEPVPAKVSTDSAGAPELHSRPDGHDTPPRSRPDPLRTTALVTGTIGAVLLLSSVPMGVIAGRPGEEPALCTPEDCLAGSYRKVYSAARASWTDSSPTNDVPHGPLDHLCSADARRASPGVAQACSERDALAGSFTAFVAVGAALGITSVATGVVHLVRQKRARRGKARGAQIRFQPMLGRSAMLMTTVRF